MEQEVTEFALIENASKVRNSTLEYSIGVEEYELGSAQKGLNIDVKSKNWEFEFCRQLHDRHSNKESQELDFKRTFIFKSDSNDLIS